MKSINDDFVSRQHDKPSPSYSYRRGGGGGLHFSFRKISIEKIVNGLVRKPVALDLSGEFVCYKVENRDEDKNKDKDKDRFKIDLDAICASIDAESLILFGPKMNLAVEDGFGA